MRQCRSSDFSREVRTNKRSSTYSSVNVRSFILENCDIGLTFCQSVITSSLNGGESVLRNNSNMLYSPLNFDIWERIDRELTPLAAAWSGVGDLKLNNAYGIRCGDRMNIKIARNTPKSPFQALPSRIMADWARRPVRYLVTRRNSPNDRVLHKFYAF